MSLIEHFITQTVNKSSTVHEFIENIIIALRPWPKLHGVIHHIGDIELTELLILALPNHAEPIDFDELLKVAGDLPSDEPEYVPINENITLYTSREAPPLNVKDYLTIIRYDYEQHTEDIINIKFADLTEEKLTNAIQTNHIQTLSLISDKTEIVPIIGDELAIKYEHIAVPFSRYCSTIKQGLCNRLACQYRHAKCYCHYTKKPNMSYVHIGNYHCSYGHTVDQSYFRVLKRN